MRMPSFPNFEMHVTGTKVSVLFGLASSRTEIEKPTCPQLDAIIPLFKPFNSKFLSFIIEQN
jgi:hypothetical protein